MLQFNNKQLSTLRLVKSDPKVLDLLQRIEKNLSNLGTLSTKAFKYLTKMAGKEVTVL